MVIFMAGRGTSVLPQSVAQLAVYSNNVQIRDKSVKAIQYACRMMVGYHVGKMSTEDVAVLSSVSFLCSMGRKAFRLCKSINCLHVLITKMSNNNIANHSMPKTIKEVAYCLELLEHVFLGLFYYYDNILFIGRAKIMRKYNAKVWDERAYGSWFLHDLIMLVRKVLLLGDCRYDMYLLSQDRTRLLAGVNHPLNRSPSLSRRSPFRMVSYSSELLEQQLQSLSSKSIRLLWDLTKSLCDVGVSGGMYATTYNGNLLFKRTIPGWRAGWQDGTIGLLGMISAVMAVADQVEDCNRHQRAPT